MSKFKTFPKGGVHPPDNISGTGNRPIRNASLPTHAVIPMSQHIGAPAECIVNVGDTIEEEQLIGKSTGYVSVPVHSSIPGKVVEIKDIYLPHGKKSRAVVIELGGEFKRMGKTQKQSDWTGLSEKEIIERISSMGLAGQGGATFPTHVKLVLPEGKKCDYLLVNAAECEPYLTSDQNMILEKAEEILEGLKILKKLLTPREIIFAIESNKPEAAAVMAEAVEKSDLDVRIDILKTKYPQGAEKNIIKSCTGREVPSGKLPLDIGMVVLNVETIYSVYEALVFEKPLVERVVTVSGGAVKAPETFRVKIGTTYRQLLEECEGLIEEPAKVISGGPMMGFGVFDLDTPVTKGTSGILFLTKKEVKAAKQTSCISCGRCIQACPMGLNPSDINKHSLNFLFEEAQDMGLLDCVECGSCAFVCPAHIPLVQSFRMGKNQLRAIMMQKKGANK
ncbi:electron transport complex subunit RsxC [Spirochaeta isovalerica]|uniref:Ion-translocating oxidoreductase complex subunit C n=1 Tax=Spirochaeta isovalerica TaxID=150 RepID=A0A841RC43_9SPIO|nr:electron transport complex subunit RsxC [Spirochaeta isovalerica]MBB6480238.1 electron transport complex protein RnfC [Spirochaeta isovalerica]